MCVQCCVFIMMCLKASHLDHDVMPSSATSCCEKGIIFTVVWYVVYVYCIIHITIQLIAYKK